jgi:hypothetical protein
LLGVFNGHNTVVFFFFSLDWSGLFPAFAPEHPSILFDKHSLVHGLTHSAFNTMAFHALSDIIGPDGSFVASVSLTFF